MAIKWAEFLCFQRRWRWTVLDVMCISSVTMTLLWANEVTSLLTWNVLLHQVRRMETKRKKMKLWTCMLYYELFSRLSLCFLVASTRLYNLLCPLVRPSVHPSVTLYFFGVYVRFWGYSSCPTASLIYFITAAAHLHATWAARYPALFLYNSFHIVHFLCVFDSKSPREWESAHLSVSLHVLCETF